MKEKKTGKVSGRLLHADRRLEDGASAGDKSVGRRHANGRHAVRVSKFLQVTVLAAGVLGMSAASQSMTEISEKEQETLLAECCRIENDYLREHGGVLYPDLEDTFKELKKTYELYIVSNCQKGYIEAFLDHYHFWDYFSDIECYGDNLLQKGDNIRLLADRNHLEEAVYVGDIQGDYDASRKAGIGFIHAAYGFGIVPEAQYKIQAFSELVTKRVAETYFRGLI